MTESSLYMHASSLYPSPPDELGELDDDGAAADAAFEEPRRWLLHRDTTELLLWWEAYEDRHSALMELERGGDGGEQARQWLGRHPEPTALHGLEANRKLVELLELRRWYVIQDAREAGASWTEIGAALGVTKQGAHDWYRRAIAKRAEIDQAHDTQRAEQAL